MADKKRKSNSGLVLQQGESQRPDGRFRYRYIGSDGKPHDVYSWRLRPQDSTPEGKKTGKSLRELEAEIRKGLDAGLRIWGADTKLNTLVRQYIDDRKTDWSPSTLDGAEYSFRKHIEPSIGQKKIAALSCDDFVRYYKDLIQNEDNPLGFSSVSSIDAILRPALDVAVRKKLISANPADKALSLTKKTSTKERPEPRHALENAQLLALLDFIKEDAAYSQYYPLFYLLAWSGLRINEALALVWSDFDFTNEVIRIRRSLSYKKGDSGKNSFRIRTPKTSSGIRDVPMLPGVKALFSGMRPKITAFPESTETVSLTNLSQFIFRNSAGNLFLHNTIDVKLNRIVVKYNSTHDDALPSISCHILRHCFTCWLCENVNTGSYADDLKYIQSVLGHSDVSTTLNIYAECRKASMTDKHEALKKRALGI